MTFASAMQHTLPRAANRLFLADWITSILYTKHKQKGENWYRVCDTPRAYAGRTGEQWLSIYHLESMWKSLTAVRSR